ncbi:MAG: Bug family tripartite tricarboxylate transporter substrate binding protein [Pseudolabrys sp.]
MRKVAGSVLAVICSLFILGGSSSHAQTWPQRPVTILVQTPPGTILDVLMRSAAQDLTEALGQTVVVESRVGGGGIVLMNAVAKADADGYVLGLATVGPAVIRPLMAPPVDYDFDRDFTPIIMLADTPNTLLVSPKLPVNTVQEFVAYAKQQPNVTMAHSGAGTIGHLAGILFGQSAGITFNFVGYRGSAPMINDLISGEISAGFPPFNPAAAKNVKILAVATDKRMDFLPDVPTMAESGYPKVMATTWMALIGPPNLPPAIVSRLNAALNAWVDKPGQRAHFSSLGLRLIGGAPQGIGKQVQDERSRWTAILRDNKITPGPQ